MKFKTLGLITTAILAVSFTGCESANNNTHTANANTNANANANVNANANTNVNANTGNVNRRAPTKEEYERDKSRYEREARESGRKVGTGLNDGWLWVKTRFDLAAVDDLRDSTINVDVDNAIVTLSGTVANAAQKAKAEQTVKTVEGVKSVKNMLKVSAGGNTNAANKNAANRNK